MAETETTFMQQSTAQIIGSQEFGSGSHLLAAGGHRLEETLAPLGELS